MTMTPPTTETGIVEKVAREVTERLWPLLGGNHTEAKLWGEIGEAILDGTRAAIAAMPDSTQPLDMMLFCPKCGLQHVDAPDERTPDWTNPPHKSHLCHGCGCIWRPADAPTNGVAAIQSRGSKDTVFYNAAAPASVPDSTQLLQTMAGALERIAATYEVVGSETDDGEVGEKTELSEWEMANIAKAALAQFRAQEQRS